MIDWIPDIIEIGVLSSVICSAIAAFVPDHQVPFLMKLINKIALNLNKAANDPMKQ